MVSGYLPGTAEFWMARAMELAILSAEAGEVPVGAVLVADNKLLAEGRNRPIGLNDPTAHAEIVALRAAGGKIGNYRLPGTTLYVTLEPCIMCMGALIQARVSRLVYGATDPKAGAVESLYALGTDIRLNHLVDFTGGVLAEPCARLLRDFFAARRGKNSH